MSSAINFVLYLIDFFVFYAATQLALSFFLFWVSEDPTWSLDWADVEHPISHLGPKNLSRTRGLWSFFLSFWALQVESWVFSFFLSFDRRNPRTFFLGLPFLGKINKFNFRINWNGHRGQPEEILDLSTWRPCLLRVIPWTFCVYLCVSVREAEVFADVESLVITDHRDVGC